jgi:excisionase family DNA binding protein|tara:strand:- start:18 stop:383 length:366 start_codon:yes stop_codon:yes gene_type:complete
MQLSIQEAAIALAVSPNTIRRRLAKGVITGTMVGNKWLIDMPEEEPPALASDKEALARGELLNQLRTDLAFANDQIKFLEGHISQLTHALAPAPIGQEPIAPAPIAFKPLIQRWRDWWRSK